MTNTCNGCSKPLLKENAWMDDGCPCNSALGVNDGNQQISNWRRELLVEARHELLPLREASLELQAFKESCGFKGSAIVEEEETGDELVDRLRGIYTIPVNDGAGLLNGKKTFTRRFPVGKIQKQAAAEILRLREELDGTECSHADEESAHLETLNMLETSNQTKTDMSRHVKNLLNSIADVHKIFRAEQFTCPHLRALAWLIFPDGNVQR